MESKLAVPPVVLKLKVPLISVASKRVSEPLAVSVPIVMLLKLLPADVRLVVLSNIQVEPVVVKVSAEVKFKVEPA